MTSETPAGVSYWIAIGSVLLLARWALTAAGASTATTCGSSRLEERGPLVLGQHAILVLIDCVERGWSGLGACEARAQ